MAEYTIDKIEYGGNTYKLQDNVSGYITTIATELDDYGIEEGAQENVLEGVQLNGTDLTITNKKVNVPVFTGSALNVAGTAGLVPAPAAPSHSLDLTQVLTSVHSWQTVLLTSTAYTDGSNSGMRSIDMLFRNTGSTDVNHTLSVVVPNADTTNPGFMSSADKVKLDGIGDYVVETSSNSYWRWTKWNSGRVELWGWFSQANVSAYATNSFVIGSASVCPYPFTISEPRTIVSGQKINNNGCHVSYDYGRTDYWSGIANPTAGITIAQGTVATITWTCYVNARWK